MGLRGGGGSSRPRSKAEDLEPGLVPRNRAERVRGLGTRLGTRKGAETRARKEVGQRRMKIRAMGLRPRNRQS